MPYVPPTIADLKLRFPSFAGVADSVLQGALDEAANRVDTTWREEDFQPAQLLYAAHVLTIDGQGTGREAKFSALGAAGISQIKISSLSVSMRKDGEDSSSTKTKSTLYGSSYGKRFLDIMRVNFPAVAVANGSP